MPNLGDITTANKIGYQGRAKFVWSACPDCGTERWRPLHNQVTRCWKCSANHRERQRKPLTFDGTGIPSIGDTARASIIGVAGRSIQVYASCPKCGVVRWTRTRYEKSECSDCTAKHNSEHSGLNHPRWKGGIKNTKGYIYVSIPKNDPLFVMVKRKYQNQGLIAEHRLVVARNIGRPLLDNEVVHHINGVKNDNRLENLRLLNEHDHHSSLVTQELQEKLVKMEARMIELEADNILIKTVLQEVRDSITSKHLNLECYNTLGSCPLKTIEGIVHSLSNKGETHESA